MSDDSEAIVFEVFKSVGSSLDKLHFAMEALGDAVVLGEAPHAGDGLHPVRKGLGQGRQRLEGTVFEFSDMPEEFLDEAKTLFLGFVLLVHELADLVKVLIERFENGVLGEEFLEPLLLFGIESRRLLAHGREVAAMVLEFRNQEACELDEVMINDSNDVEAIGNDAGVGKVSLNESSVGTGEVDANELNTVPALEFT